MYISQETTITVKMAPLRMFILKKGHEHGNQDEAHGQHPHREHLIAGENNGDDKGDGHQQHAHGQGLGKTRQQHAVQADVDLAVLELALHPVGHDGGGLVEAPSMRILVLRGMK